MLQLKTDAGNMPVNVHSIICGGVVICKHKKHTPNNKLAVKMMYECIPVYGCLNDVFMKRLSPFQLTPLIKLGPCCVWQLARGDAVRNYSQKESRRKLLNQFVVIVALGD